MVILDTFHFSSRSQKHCTLIGAYFNMSVEIYSGCDIADQVANGLFSKMHNTITAVMMSELKDQKKCAAAIQFNEAKNKRAGGGNQKPWIRFFGLSYERIKEYQHPA